MRKLIKFITDWLNAKDVKAGDTGGNILYSFMRHLVATSILIAVVAYFIYTIL